MRLLCDRLVLALIAAVSWIAIAGRLALGDVLPADPGAAPATQPALVIPAGAAFERVTQCATRVYHNEFDSVPGPEWSKTKISRTKIGDRSYLGDFTPGTPVTLTLSGLPPHKLVRISFDLYLQRSWDGSSSTWGTTQWDLELGDGRSLIHTTFCNCGFFSDNNEQAFPDTYPARPHPAWTGALENQTLGFIQSWGGPDRTFDASSVYRLVLTFPHADENIIFRFFSATKLDQRKYFGLANVQVDTLSEIPRHTDAEFARMWKDLGSAHYPRFYRAQWDLIESGVAAADYLSRHMDESADLSDKEIHAILEELPNSTGSRTDALLQTLVMQGPAAADPIDEALAAQDLPQQVRDYLNNCKDLIQRFPESATELRLQRTKQLLQIIRPDAAVGPVAP